MAPSTLRMPRHRRAADTLKQEPNDPFRRLCGIPTPLVFATTLALALSLFRWTWPWLYSGAPILTFFILLGASKGHRILPLIDIWTLIATLNLGYSVAATSWLLRGVFVAGCYPAIFLSCLFQFSVVSNFVRHRLRSLLSQLHFVNDTIAFFDIPAMEIDTEVAGLMVVRGLTISLSSLTVIAHGVELGIKLSDDMELAIQTETVKIPLFRGIEVGDVYANLKGGVYEMTFGKLEESTEDADGDPLMNTNTALLRAATMNADTEQPDKIKMTDVMTAGKKLRDSSARDGLESVTQLSPDDDMASRQYEEMLRWIRDTSAIAKIRRNLRRQNHSPIKEGGLDTENDKDLRAAICSHLHDTPSVPHPPKRSIRVTTLQNLSPPHVRRFLHRLPFLLRLLLNPLAYFHPLSIQSITAAGSGAWIKHMLSEKIFLDYSDNASELRSLEAKISTWLSDANFVLEMVDITGLAQVPVATDFDINCNLGINDLMAYRTLPEQIKLNQVVRLGGADAAFAVPSCLLPHHEHILPPLPTSEDKARLEREVDLADGKPKTVQAEQSLLQVDKDELNVEMSVHGRLPACFDQELLNFITALVKATKLVEMEKEPSAMDEEYSGLRDFARNLNRATKDSMKKAVVGGIVNDKWIAKMVGKVTKSLETAHGDVGYSGGIPVQLAAYRPKGKLASKLLA